MKCYLGHTSGSNLWTAFSHFKTAYSFLFTSAFQVSTIRFPSCVKTRKCTQLLKFAHCFGHCARLMHASGGDQKNCYVYWKLKNERHFFYNSHSTDRCCPWIIWVGSIELVVVWLWPFCWSLLFIHLQLCKFSMFLMKIWESYNRQLYVLLFCKLNLPAN